MKIFIRKYRYFIFFLLIIMVLFVYLCICILAEVTWAGWVYPKNGNIYYIVVIPRLHFQINKFFYLFFKSWFLRGLEVCNIVKLFDNKDKDLFGEGLYIIFNSILIGQIIDFLINIFNAI